MTRLVLAEPLYLMGEGNLLLATGAQRGYAGLLQLDLEVVRGLHMIATGEVLDEGYRDDPAAAVPPAITPGFGSAKYGAWGSIDWFFYKQLEFRFDVVARQESPLTLLAQLHFFL
jgi:hypothetical protein